VASSTERFAKLGEAEIQKLLEDKDSLNTKRSTKASRVIFEDYLKAKSLNFPQNKPGEQTGHHIRTIHYVQYVWFKEIYIFQSC
jgi:hypothetical protein